MFPAGMFSAFGARSEEQEMEQFLQEMADAKVDRAVAMGRTASAGFLAANVPNEDVAELVRQYPNKFVGFGSVDVRDPTLALMEVEKCVDLGLAGIAFDNPLSTPPLRNDDASLMRIYERCAKKNLIVSINASASIGPDISYSDPVYIQRMAAEFPKLPIVVTHACWPYVTEMIAVALQGLLYETYNVYYVADYVAIPNAPRAAELLEAASFYGLYRKILFGSSYPVNRPLSAVNSFRNLLSGDSEAEHHVMGSNAAILLGL